MSSYRIIGPGRAGGSLDAALNTVGWVSAGILGRDQSVESAAQNVDVVIIAVPDDAIAGVAQAITAGPAVVMHMAGSRTLAELAPHEKVASIHPLMSLPNKMVGAQRLLDNCMFAVAGDPIAALMVEQLGGTQVRVDDSARATYHAGATVAGNHAVALWAQVERLAAMADIPAASYWPLMRTSLENAVTLSAHDAITGPASRGDWHTCRSHLEAIGVGEAELYRILAGEAAKLGHLTFPEELL